MFGFNWLRSPGAYNNVQDKAGIQFLASLLVCYPEVSSVQYDPKMGDLILDFILQGEIDWEKINPFTHFLQESLDTYHALEDGQKPYLAITGEAVGEKTVLLHITREVATLRRGELTLITELMHTTFGSALVVDNHSLDNLENDFATVQSDLLDQMLGQAQEMRFKSRMVGVREGDRVVVYNR